jgi:predicted nucleic acid-binding protein
MNVYLDTSVILGRLLGQSNQLSSWGTWEACYTSALTRVEFLRTVDRLRLNGKISDRERVELQAQFGDVWGATHRVTLSQELLDGASVAMPTVLGTLDAIHLVTALQVIESQHLQLIFLTHDDQLATAAMAMGLQVTGVPR